MLEYASKKHNSQNLCEKCNRIFKNKAGLSSHLNMKRPCSQKLICEKCGKNFKSIYDLNKHLARKTSCESLGRLEPVAYRSIDDEIRLLDKKTELKLKIIEAQKDKVMAIEELKAQRKVNPTMIIQNNDNRIQLQVINNYINTLPTNGILDASIGRANEAIDNYAKKITPDLARELLSTGKDFHIIALSAAFSDSKYQFFRYYLMADIFLEKKFEKLSSKVWKIMPEERVRVLAEVIRISSLSLWSQIYRLLPKIETHNSDFNTERELLQKGIENIKTLERCIEAAKAIFNLDIPDNSEEIEDNPDNDDLSILYNKYI